MKYRKKPVVIEAFKWTGGPDQEEDPKWLLDAIESGEAWFVNGNSPDVKMQIKTLEGIMEASVGDYIIRGIKDEIYPCKPYIFEETYEPVMA